MDLPMLPVALNDLLEQVIELTRARWLHAPEEKGITIELDRDFQVDLPLVSGVENELRDAAINLILNATDAMPEGGTLTVRTAVAPNPAVLRGGNGRRSVVLEVTDTGVGMDEATKRNCLEPFFTTKGARGTGLGLAMVYGMAKRHGVDVEIDTRVGGGTTIRLVFDEAPADLVPVAAHVPLRGVPRLALLLIDDDPVLSRAEGTR
jgi:signal transduction histidine kinase